MKSEVTSFLVRLFFSCIYKVASQAIMICAGESYSFLSVGLKFLVVRDILCF